MSARRFGALVAICVACGRFGFEPIASSPGGVDAPHGDAIGLASCLPSPLATPLYSSPTFADFASAWTTGGTGSWAVSASQLAQTKTQTNVMLAYAAHAVTATDYRVVANLHSLGGAAIGRAVEIALRVDPSTSSMFHCNWESADTAIVMNLTVNGGSGPELGRVMVPAANVADPSNVTMEFQVVGSLYECCIVGAAGS